MLNNSFTSHSLAILMWNANGLTNHRNELILTLNEKITDLVLIFETYFTTNTKFSIPGYNIITSNHPDNTSHTGAAIIIKSSLPYTTFSSIQENYLQAATLSIKLNHIPITIAAI
jgi:exonuclease III